MTAADRPVALVAGGSRGLGLIIARDLLDADHHVVICSRSEDALRRAASNLDPTGERVAVRVCDVSDEGAVSRMIADVEESVGPIEVALVVAGTIQVGPLEAMRHEHFRNAIDTMLWGPVNVCLPLAKRMRSRGRGRIGIVTSIGGMVSVPHLLPYSTAKFGAFGFAQGLRAELAGSGVSVTTIVPGLMRVGSHLNALFAGDHGKEYAWFAAGASAPLLAMDADRAASQIVRAVLGGRGLVILTPLAKVGARVHGLAPGTTGALLGAVGRLLPAAPGTDTGTVDGHTARARMSPRARRVIDAVTVLGQRAALRNREGRTGPTS